MGDTDILIIAIAVGIVLGILLLKFALRSLINKGTDAIGNARRQHKNETQGPQIERLADLYPEIAVKHYQAGTATEMNPALMRATTTAQVGTATAAHAAEQTYPGMAAEQTYPGMAAGIPVSDDLPIMPKKKVKDGRVALIIGTVLAVIGILGNWMAIEVLRHEEHVSNYRLSYTRFGIAFCIVSILGYAVLVMTRRTVYVLFYSICSAGFGVLITLIVHDHDEFFRIPDAKASQAFYPTYLAIVMLIAILVYYWKGWKACLWVAFGVSLFVMDLGGIVLDDAGATNYHLVPLLNFMGYGLLLLFYGYSESRRRLKA